MKLPLIIYSSKAYWKFRSRIQTVIFRFRKNYHLAKESIQSEQFKVFSFASLVRFTFWNVLRSILFVISLYAIEYYANSLWNARFNEMPDWLVYLQGITPKPTYPDSKDAVIEMLSVIASITGVVLALFYPILATIVSTAYAKVNESIRNLVLREKTTQEYLRKLTFVTAYSLSVLLALSFGYYPGNLILSILFLLVIICLFNLLQIGMGVYTLLEPSNLLRLVRIDIAKYIKNATVSGLYWNDKSFQRNNYSNAHRETENINLITQLCLKDYFKESSFKSVVETSISILRYYLDYKNHIPVDSDWFPKVSNHVSYFESDMSKRALSNNTQTFVLPNSTQNHFWIEERIVKNISDSLGHIMKERKDLYGTSIEMCYPFLNSLSFVADINTAELLFKPFFQNLTTLAKSGEDKIITYEDYKEELISVEAYCYALLGFQASFFERVSNIDSSKITNEYQKVSWQNKKTIYNTDFPFDAYEHLEKYRQFVMNEYSVEGERITPDWFFKQLLTAEYLFKISKKVHETILLFDKYLLNAVRHFNKTQEPLLCAFTSLMGLEIIHKLKYRLVEVKETFDDINHLETCKGEFTWTKPDFEKIDGELKAYEHECIIAISNNSEGLSKISWSNQYPDVFGRCYSVLSTYLNECLRSNNLPEFKNHFPVFLKCAINSFGNLNKIFKDYTRPQDISYQTLVDVMQISGYAYLYAAVYKNDEYWEITKSMWDSHFMPDKTNIGILAINYNYYRNNLHGVGVNFNEKSQREQSFNDTIESLGVRPSDVDDFLVKPFIESEGRYAFTDPAELFIELYLFTFPPAKEAAQAMTRRHVFDDICRHVKYSNTRNNDDDF